MSLPYPCLDSTLPHLSPQIPITSVCTALANHCFTTRGEEDEVSSRFFSAHLLHPKQFFWLVSSWEVGKDIKTVVSRHFYFLQKNTEGALGGDFKGFLFTAQRNGYFVIQNESNFKACKGQKQPLAKQEEEADGNYTSTRGHFNTNSSCEVAPAKS